MKKSQIVLITLFILFLCVYTANIVYGALTGGSLVGNIASPLPYLTQPKEQEEILDTTVCSDMPAIEKIEDINEVHLAKLARYQEICGSFVTDEIMIFTDMPKDAVIATESAKKMSETLKIFHSFGIHPIVIVEPATEWGLIDFQEFTTGFYDGWITTYFDALKAEGVTDEMMGKWVPFPEANLPLWNHANATPADYATGVNSYAKILKSRFPNAHVSVLLNSATYENDDFNWANGDYVSLREYVVGLDKNLIDSFGMQGFPWVPTGLDPVGGSVLNPSEFLVEDLLVEAAETLDVKEVWYNTGTFGAKYTIDPELTNGITPEVRGDILDGILSQAIKLRDKGYTVTINVFAEDKSTTAEATDWSYLSDSFSGSLKTEAVFRSFAAKVTREEGITLSIFDR